MVYLLIIVEYSLQQSDVREKYYDEKHSNAVTE